MAILKEKNFISAVLYLDDEHSDVEFFLQTLTDKLSSRFETYELVFVNDACPENALEKVKAFLASMPQKPSTTIIHMSLKQGPELAMNAGLDMAIGDFVYEFDALQMPYPSELIDEAYDTCLKGNDIVSVSPQKSRSFSSNLFYSIFNYSSRSKYKLRTDIFRIVSRRGINRVHAISPHMPYRKAAYAASGLKLETLFYDGEAGTVRDNLRLLRAIDSLALYTEAAFRASLIISIGMFFLMLVAIIYIVAVYINGQPMEGWTTTMLVLTGGFFGVFLVLSIITKYLSLLVELVFRQQKYLVESVEKVN